ncbi:Beta,beta-carotene 15,15'-monooxygenase [Orchesella cincta]|uniref:Beta,beta-carotene 15,15'-monooxygenase n=1 Tax=Orchesella cincta TaxID=48709 RepID=A0A1D2MGE1_ORCCI|nr:Beta,beta-carotene 15,15'-monooxygenase [Orchesella cincta]
MNTIGRTLFGRKLKSQLTDLRSLHRNIANMGKSDWLCFTYSYHFRKGTIPTWLQGELIRNGPGIQKIGNDSYTHIFDGLAILHKFTLKDGKANYQSRALRSDAYKKNMEANRIVVSEFGTHAVRDPCQSLFGRLKSDFSAVGSLFGKTQSENDITDNCCVNVGYYGDQLYSMTETNFVRRVDPETLETLGPKTNIGNFVAINSATAHPHILEDGTAINVGNSYRHAGGPHYCFIKVPPSFQTEQTSFENAKLIAEIPSRWKMSPAYFHSFGITKSGKLIFVEYPLCLNLLGLAAGEFMRRSYAEWMTWYPKEKTRFHVISMDDGKLHPVIYETDQLFLFHHINAFEQDDELIVDVAGYSDGEWVGHITTKDTLKEGNFSEKSSARRYVLPLNVESAKPGENLVKLKGATATASLRAGEKKSTIDLTPQHFSEMLELPRINYKYNGQNYTYIYGIGQTAPSTTYKFEMNVVTKIDVVTGKKIDWVPEEGTMASEPVFVPDPTKANPEEDDGVILTALLPTDKPTNVSLLVLDAKTMKEVARAEFSAEGAVTGTFHGQWAQTGEKIHLY